MKKYLTYTTDKEYKLTENLYLCESEYLNYSLTLEGLKEASRDDNIQLLSSMAGNFSIPELFLGTTEELYDYLREDRADEMDVGAINIDRENLNISELIKHLRKGNN